jgi:hypothetical protein
MLKKEKLPPYRRGLACPPKWNAGGGEVIKSKKRMIPSFKK